MTRTLATAEKIMLELENFESVLIADFASVASQNGTIHRILIPFKGYAFLPRCYNSLIFILIEQKALFLNDYQKFFNCPMKFLFEKITGFLKREWFLLVMITAIGLIVLLFKVF